MKLRKFARPFVIVVSLTVVLIVVTSAFGSFTNTAVNKACRQVAVQLDTKQTSQEQITSILREQLSVCGRSATDDEVQTAARNTLNLIGKSKDPQKGVIYINTKKFTICASWGRDKNFCKSH